MPDQPDESGIKPTETETEIENALDTLFEEKVEAPSAEAETSPVEGEGGEAGEEPKTIEAAQSRLRRKIDVRLDRVMGPILKALISTEQVTEQDLKLVLQATATKVVEAVNALAITIYVIHDDGKIHFDYVYYSPRLWQEDPSLRTQFKANAEKLMQMTLDQGTGIVGKVLQTRKPHTALDARRDPAFYKKVMEQTGFEIRTMITVPIADEKNVFGAVQVMNKDPRSGEEFFSHRDLQRLEEVASYSARIINKSRNKGYKLDEVELAKYIARLTNCEYVDLGEYEPNAALLQSIGEENLRKWNILPLAKTGMASLKVAMANPTDVGARDHFSTSVEMQLSEILVATEKQINKFIDEFFHQAGMADIGKEVAKDLGVEELSMAEDATENSKPIVRLANQVIEDAYTQGASDIHIEPFEKEVRVRYRIDGECQEKLKLPPAVTRPLVARLKIMSGLDISERRLPQDGRIKFSDFSGGRINIDLRVATAPMQFGEKVVMRILDKTATTLGLEMMGYSKTNLERYREVLKQPYGMILHCGPTGSGKTTTLYSALATINTPDINIQTIEDPIEYPMYGINQLQAHKQIGLDFSRALRAYLRQDPDVILVGEIRDEETAEIAIEAALTGHLLFSTLHTNDAGGTVTRFIEMGIAPFLVSSSILCICAQRLMRKLCTNCKKQKVASKEERELAGIPLDAPDDKAILYVPGGCQRCNKSGYKGRIGTHEMLVMNGALRDLVIKCPSSEDVKRCARETAGMITLFQDAMEKVRNGITSLEEAMTNVRKD